MSDIGIGKIIMQPMDKDAIHIAVAPVVAYERLAPGTPIGLIGNDATAGIVEAPIGIVDPFLPDPVEKGQTFWMFLHPGSITSLRHDWTHPAFAALANLPPPRPGIDSRAWIKDFAELINQTPETLMDAAETYVDTDEYTYDNSQSYDRVSSEGWDEFWRHYEAVTGRTIKQEKKGGFFACSC